MISIVIPTLNSGRYINDTLASIIVQDYKDWEVIVVDSHSEDATQRIILGYQRLYPRIKLVLMGKWGQINAINHGLSLAKGDILTFLNSDDVYEQGCLGRVAQEFATKQGLEWLYGVGKVIDHSGIPTRSLVTQFKSVWWHFCNYRVLTLFDYICQPTVFWSNSVDLTFNPEYPYCFDYEAWLRLWKNFGQPLFVNQHLANWRAHKDSVSVKNTNAQIDESLRINIQYAQSTWDIAIQNIVAWGEKIVYGVMK